MMTTHEALKLAQKTHPLDLAARMAYIRTKQDTCEEADRVAWTTAAELTRNGAAA